ncbi:peptide chain release factor 1 [Terasakiella brassicae]|uniref:Peptide chain release factor 1 n=1 Tax=Terasakiella brassicae TaxID=1634917 RepID=A0A917C484_9PROT|nr:peptide chain release factor 1 [Terasakiella brassicae]GGF71502.1 peptide chain release factor 1 [Terasakiella brassicae]
MSFQEALSQVVNRHEELAALMSDASSLNASEFTKMSKEYAELTPVVEVVNALRNAQGEMAECEQMLADPDCDADMKELAEAEYHDLKKRVPELERDVQLMLLPKDEADEKNAILEIRAGTGGDEAALFAADLYRMYQRYAERMGWKFELLDVNEIGIGGFKEVSVNITGKNVFARFKYESGVHRVQRVPATESGGRIHTSAATVAVLPEAEDVDIKVEAKDLRIDTYRSQGAGGQHVNTTDSAVRITHIPTGLVTQCQDNKSQHKNKEQAMKMMRAKLYDHERQQLDAERAADRKNQVGSGDRSERIRTYNFPQGRVSDHRINLTLYRLDEVLQGDLDEVIDALIAEDQAQKLAELS